MAQGPTRADFKNEQTDTANTDQAPADAADKDTAPVRPKSDRWSHDGFDQMMKVQDKSFRTPRNDRPRSMIVKVL